MLLTEKVNFNGDVNLKYARANKINNISTANFYELLSNPIANLTLDCDVELEDLEALYSHIGHIEASGNVLFINDRPVSNLLRSGAKKMINGTIMGSKTFDNVFVSGLLRAKGILCILTDSFDSS